MAIKIKKFHIGEAISDKIRSMGLTQRKFGEMIGVPQPEVTRLLKKENYDTDKLFAICLILNYNFFEDFKTIGASTNSTTSEDTNNTESGGNPAGFDALINRIEQLAIENSKLKDVVGEKNQYISELENRLSKYEDVKKVV